MLLIETSVGNEFDDSTWHCTKTAPVAGEFPTEETEAATGEVSKPIARTRSAEGTADIGNTLMF